MLRVCQYCYYILKDNNDATEVKWDKVSPASHGVCTAHIAEVRKLLATTGDCDSLIDATAHERNY